MLGKLIKYDIRSTWRDFAGVYLAILLGVLVLPPLFKHVDNEIVNMFAGFLAMGIVIGTIVIMVGTLFRIFNKNVYSKEGYLTMTLPVTSTQIVVSKLLVSTMWIILTSIVGSIAVYIFVIGLDLHAAPFEEMAAGIRKFFEITDSRGITAAVLLLIAMLISTVKGIAKLFLACSIAHLKQIGRFRVAIGIFSYFALSWVETLIVQAATFVLSLIPGLQDWVSKIDSLNDPAGIQQFTGLFNGVLVGGILYSLLLTAAFAVGTIWLMNRKLDLD